MNSLKPIHQNNCFTAERKFLSLPLERVLEDGSFCGYASLFDRIDLGKDRMRPGAFAKSLSRRGASRVRMLFQHDPAQPIGTWSEVREDRRGLFVTGRIARESPKGAEVLSLMRAGAIDGLSIGFRTGKARIDPKSGVRDILEADLWEISVVTFPMLPEARISQVKSVTPLSRNRRLPSIREFERWLTRDAGLTRSEARTVIGKGFAHIAGTRDAAGATNAAFAQKVRRAASLINARRTTT